MAKLYMRFSGNNYSTILLIKHAQGVLNITQGFQGI